WTPGDRLTFVANPTYYFVPGARLERIVWQRFPDPGALEAAARSGEVDAAVVDDATGRRLNRDAGWATGEMQGGVRRLVFQTERVPLMALRMRRALAYAIARRTVLGRALGGAGVVSTADVPPIAWAYNASPTVARYERDPDRSRRLLDDAGWTVAGSARRLDLV